MLTTGLSGVVTCCKLYMFLPSLGRCLYWWTISRNGISVSVYSLDIFIAEIYSFYLNNVIFIKRNKIIRCLAILFRPSFAPKHLMFIVTGDGYYRNAPCALNLISTFLLHQLSFQLSYCKNVPDFSPTGGVYVGVERWVGVLTAKLSTMAQFVFEKQPAFIYSLSKLYKSIYIFCI